MLGVITHPSMNSIPKTTFTSPVGKYEYLKVPFGLAQAPVYFQELMNKVLKDFHKLCNAELSMKLSKCHFFAKEI